MTVISMWNSTARGRRSIADLAAIIKTSNPNQQRYPVALVVGAGLDMSLRRRPNWPGLIYKLASESGIEEQRGIALRNLAFSWPVESAEALRNLIGSVPFWNAVRTFVASDAPIEKSTISEGVNNLIDAGMRLIISLNYTPDLLIAIARANSMNKKVRIIDRSNLPSWNYQPLFYPPGDAIHVIYIHGKVDEKGTGEPTAVLDRKGYDSATLSSTHYSDLWRRLFQDFSVITLGLSWTDVPIRNAAAEVQFNNPISARQHYAIFPQEELLQDMWKERGMINSYSVRPLFYTVKDHDYSQAGLILTEIAKEIRPESFIDPIPPTQLVKMAEQLDQLGDFESGVQSDWMSSKWVQARNAIANFSEKDLTPQTWLALAKIERHLRHFLWFYLSPEERGKVRKELWLKVSELWLHLPRADKEMLWNFDRINKYSISLQHGVDYISPNDRGLLEFGLGAFEVSFARSDNELPESVTVWRNQFLSLEVNPDSLWGKRTTIAKTLWSSTSKTKSDLEELRKIAGLSRWEGIEAKIVLDIFQSEFSRSAEEFPRFPREWGDSTKRNLLPLYNDAYAVSRTAGCLRREVGAVVQGSFVIPLQEAERNLIAIHERFLENSGRQQELSMVWWIYLGLLAVFCEQRQPRYEAAEAQEWLCQRCGQIRLPSENVLKAIKRNSIPHWRNNHKTAAELTESLLRNLMPDYDVVA
jgi:hypothetical protein